MSVSPLSDTSRMNPSLEQHTGQVTKTVGRTSWQTSSPQAEALLAHRDDVLAAAARVGATRVRVFGSVVRGEAGPDSDIDLWVTVDDQRLELEELNDLACALTDLLGYDVDVITDRIMSSTVRRNAAIDAQTL